MSGIEIEKPKPKDGLLILDRQKAGVTSCVRLTKELKSIISRTSDISPTSILFKSGKPYKGEAANAAGMKARLHGLRKAFCVYWAEQERTTNQIAAMAGHLTLAEDDHYTRAVDREKSSGLL